MNFIGKKEIRMVTIEKRIYFAQYVQDQMKSSSSSSST